jgi:hypothetical protein
MSTFWTATEHANAAASAISQLLFASRLYQVLRSIAKLAFQDTACRLILLSNSRGSFWTCDHSTVTWPYAHSQPA